MLWKEHNVNGKTRLSFEQEIRHPWYVMIIKPYFIIYIIYKQYFIICILKWSDIFSDFGYLNYLSKNQKVYSRLMGNRKKAQELENILFSSYHLESWPVTKRRFFNPCFSTVPLWPPWKHQKTFGFQMFPGGSKGNIGEKWVKYNCTIIISYHLPRISLPLEENKNYDFKEMLQHFICNILVWKIYHQILVLSSLFAN